MSPLTIVRIVETSAAYPSQWSGWDALANNYNFHYRSGRLTVTDDDEEELFCKQLGLPGCGVMTYDELRYCLQDVMVFVAEMPSRPYP